METVNVTGWISPLLNSVLEVGTAILDPVSTAVLDPASLVMPPPCGLLDWQPDTAARTSIAASVIAVFICSSFSKTESYCFI